MYNCVLLILLFGTESGIHNAGGVNAGGASSSTTRKSKSWSLRKMVS